MRGNIKEIYIKISCDANIFIIFKADFGDEWPNVCIVETVGIHRWMFVDYPNNVVSSVWVYYFNESGFKGFGCVDIEICAGLGWCFLLT